MAVSSDFEDPKSGLQQQQNGRMSNQSPSYGHHPSYDESQRPLRVLISGAGPSGIALGIELQKIHNVTFQIFEKNHDVGGTWLENRYLGAACDVASHAYQYSFESNPDWSSHFSPAEEIWRYFKGVAQKYDVVKHVQFNSRVASACWDEETSTWSLDVQVGGPGVTKQMVTVQGDVFINAGGILNDWKWPDIPGLHDFKGKLIHTAKWDSSWNWEGQSVAVVGSGATSIQVVPGLQPKAKHVDVYVRSPTYILPSVGFGIESSTFNQKYSEAEKKSFRNDPERYIQFRKKIEQQMNENFLSSVKGSQAQKDGRAWAEKMMRQTIKSQELQDKLVPCWELNCRRLTPGMPYLLAVQQENVDVIRTPIDSITTKGLKTSDGVVHEVDAIVCATGFNTSFSAAYDIFGRNHQNLRDIWTQQPPEGYMGLAISGYPNYFTMLGPNTPIANGSLIPCMESSVKYICQVIVKMQTEQIKSVEIKRSRQDAFNAYTQAVHEDLVWTGACRSWYKDPATGKVVAVWPGSSIHYMEVVKTPRWEDYDINYCQENPFSFMGNGISRLEKAGGDLTYYLDNPASSMLKGVEALEINGVLR